MLAAILKPWAWGVPAASEVPLPPPRAFATEVAPSPTVDVSARGLAASVCLGTDAWRVASLETWNLIVAGKPETQQVRVWRAVSPLGFARGPLDPAIPVVAVAATEVDALGWCAPITAADALTGPIQVSAWRVAADGATAAPLTLRRIAPAVGDTPYAALYREVIGCTFDESGFGQVGSGAGCSTSSASHLAPTWAGGEVVFRYVSPDERTWWFAADVLVLPEPTAPAG